MPAEQFFRSVLHQLCAGDFPQLDLKEVHRATDALQIALTILQGGPAPELGLPYPVIGYAVGCPECRPERQQFCGIAFSSEGALAVLAGHKNHSHLL